MTLPHGLIFEIAEHAQLKPRGSGDRRVVCCPFHEDENASAFLRGSKNLFFCSVCTPEGGWSAKRFAAELGANWDECLRGLHQWTPRPRPKGAIDPQFSPADAQGVWAASFASARDDAQVAQHRPAYEYLNGRGLSAASELGVFGLLSADSSLHTAITAWPSRNYLILAPLFDMKGKVCNVQARAIDERKPKTMFPTGSRVSGTLFADQRGASVLRSESVLGDTLIFGEGLTDLLALSIASPVPVFTAPGTSCALAAVGDWARDRQVLLALDCDDAGNRALKPVAAALYAHGAKRVRRIVWPAGASDACDVIKSCGATGLSEFLRRLIVEVAA